MFWCLQKKLDRAWKQLYSAQEALETEKKQMEEMNGEDTVVIELNVGKMNHTVQRSALTSVDGSLISNMFSGRWDQQLGRDKEGRVFLDFDPHLFGIILNHLRHLGYARNSFFNADLVEECKRPAFLQLVLYLGLDSIFANVPRIQCEMVQLKAGTAIKCSHCH